MKASEKRITALDTWRDTFTQIGKYIVHFQELEDTLSACISALVGRDRKLGNMIACELSFRAKVNLLASLIVYRLDVDKLPEDIRKVLAEVEQAEQRRNALAHSLWDVNLKDPEFTMRIKSRCHRHKGHHTEEELLEPDDLDVEARYCESIAEDVVYVFAEYLPNYAKRL